MRVQATVVLEVRAESLREAGEVVDEVLELVGGRPRVRVEHVELSGPADPVRVSLPATPAPEQPAPGPPAPPGPVPRRPEPTFGAPRA